MVLLIKKIEKNLIYWNRVNNIKKELYRFSGFEMSFLK